MRTKELFRMTGLVDAIATGAEAATVDPTFTNYFRVERQKD